MELYWQLPALVTAIASVCATIFFRWIWTQAAAPEVSGDAWYYRMRAFTDSGVSAPYCWRPLFPLVARYVGFDMASLVPIMLTPLVVYGYVGGGWTGTACALAMIGIRPLFSFNIKNVDYAEGMGQFLFVSALWAMSAGHGSAWVLAPLCMLLREGLGVAVACVAVFVWPWLTVPTLAAGALAYFTRKEDTENPHPLIEKSAYATLVRWMKVKLDGCLHYAQTVQPLRGSPFAVPFVWQAVSSFSRWSLCAVPAIWFFSLPASGQSRHSCYLFAVFIPFIAAAGIEWCWLYCLACWFWPIDFSTYDETGGPTFGYAR